MKKATQISAVIFCMFVSLAVNAQNDFKIAGAVKSADNKAIESASVSLLKLADSSLVKIAISNKDGNFIFEKIKNNAYVLKIEAVGYATYFSNAIQLADSSVTVPEIKIEATSTQLGAVIVASKRPLIENKIDKTVVNVDASPTNGGLSALEVLEKSPGVTVDNNGNISLKGKQGVIVLIDGKQTYLSGQDLANYLKNMPANQLDQIEIMTQPPAKYDAAGNSGIINLTTKKNKTNGFNGTVTTSAIIAQYFKNTNSININWRQGKTNIFAQYSFSDWRGFNDIYINRSLRDSINLPYNRYSNQHTFGRDVDNEHNFKIGIDYSIDKKTTLSFTLNGTIENESFTSNGVANIYDSTKQFVQYNVANSQVITPQTNLGFDLNFDKKLDDKGQDLTVDGDFIFYNTPANTFTNNYLYNADNAPSELPYLLNGLIPSDIDIYTLKADYKKPLKHDAAFEAGFKTSYVQTNNNAQYTLYNNDTQKWEPDDTLSNHFIYKENINAAYISLQKKLNKKFGAQLGLRAEQTISNGNLVTKDTSFRKNYIQLFPTAYFTYNRNDNNTFELSYGRRIDRPDYSSLNPFQFQLDRYTYKQGNPNLQPQFSHNVEVSYNYKGQLNITANFTRTINIINDVLITTKQPGDSNYTTYLTSQNIASNTNIGLAVNYTKPLKKWWTINIYGNLFNNNYKGVIEGDNIDVSKIALNGNFSSQFTFTKGWSAEISGWYNGKNYDGALLTAPMGMFSFGGGKQLFKGKASIKLNIRDPFYLAHFEGSSYLGNGFTQIKSYWDNRRGIITFTYRFGKNTSQQQQHNNGSQDEQSRVKTGGGQN